MRLNPNRWAAGLVLGAMVLAAGCTEERIVVSPIKTGASSALVLDATSLSVAEGQSGQIGVHLAEQPANDVVLEASLVDTNGPLAITGGATLTFTPANWDQPQFVIVSASPDADVTNYSTRISVHMGGVYVMSVDVIEVDDQQPPAGGEDPPPDDGGGGAPPPGPPIDPGEPQEGVTLTVRDASGQGAVGYPVTAVVPLKYGLYQNTDNFRMVDGQGDPIPAQFEVLNRWWARDRSIRHVMVHFQASVGANSHSFYAFQTQNGAGPAPAEAVSVTDAGGVVTVNTGALRFTVKKTGFNLFDEVFLDSNDDGTFSAGERIVAPGSAGPVFTGRLAGDIQRASDRGNLRVVVEENGPMRSVVRISGLTDYQSANDHTHGFAVRLYAYAGQSMVKVDYQLQNSAKNKTYTSPLYLEDMSLNIKPSLSGPTATLATGPGARWTGPVDSGRYVVQYSDDSSQVRNSSDNSVLRSGTNPEGRPSFGWADLSDANRGMFVTTRHMAEMWPNGYEVESDGNVAIRLWPRWSAQIDGAGLNSTGLYWIEDMQQVVKESLVYFHTANVTTDDLDRLAMNFSRHPIPFVPIAEYGRTKSTFIWGGLVPITEEATGDDTRELLLGSGTAFERTTTAGRDIYNLGWTNFLANVDRKIAASGGGIPESSLEAVATGQIDHWVTAEGGVWGELNCRGQWCAEYSYEDDFELLHLTQDPYGARSWRGYVTGNEPDLPFDSPHIAGTSWGGWYPRDNAHAWYYHVDEWYYLTGNPWIRDWYEFIAEFRKSERSNEGFSNWSWFSTQGFATVRGEGHSLANAMQAFRITGDMEIIEWLKMRLRNLGAYRIEKNGSFGGSGLNRGVTSQFEHGYLATALIQMIDETESYVPEVYDLAFNYLWGIVAFNTHQATFTYHFDYDNPDPFPADSAGSSMPLADPHAYFVLLSGMTEYQDVVVQYLDGGLNGGRGPFNGLAEMKNWTGASLGRVTHYLTKFPVQRDAPAAITNLTASTSGGKVQLDWTTPAEAHRLVVLWSTKPISATYTTDETKANPFACTPVHHSLAANPGAAQSIQFDGAPSGQTVHCIVLTRGANGHLSPISNIAAVTAP